MTPTVTKLITAEEFGRMPEPADGSQEELVKGVIVTFPTPKARHGFVQTNIGCVLGTFVEDRRLGRVFIGSGIVLGRNPDTVRGPDVSYFSRHRLPAIPDEYFEIPPDIVVEVLEPNEDRAVREKVREYIAAGVQLVWLVDPETKTVTVYAGSMRGVEFDVNDTLDGGDVLPGFSCKVADFFE